MKKRKEKETRTKPSGVYSEIEMMKQNLTEYEYETKEATGK